MKAWIDRIGRLFGVRDASALAGLILIGLGGYLATPPLGFLLVGLVLLYLGVWHR